VQPTLQAADAGPFERDRIQHVNDLVLDELSTSRPELRTFDLFEVLCPDGEFVTGMDGVDVLRTDGVHFSSEGSAWFAETFGERMLALAEP
jgi:hypothetical protein